MINTIELEKRWIKYKTKIFASLFFILFFMLAIPYLSFYLFEQYQRIQAKDKNISNVTVKDKVEQKIELKKIETNITKISSVEKQSIVDTGIKDVVLSPSIPIIDFNQEKQIDREVEKKKVEIQRKRDRKIREERERAYRKKVAKRRALKRKRELEKKELKKKKLIKAKASSSLSSSELKVVSGKDIEKNHSEEPKKINFKSTNSNYMPIMKRKFEQNKNPREAILIAKAYYHAGNYIESEKWALTANNLDKENSESWLLFAKSKAKLGKRKEALKVLSTYYKKSKSPEVRELIDKIKGGSF